LVDLFNGINVPETFLSPDFFKQLQSLLNKEGEILMNFVAYNYETKQKVKEIEEMATKIFPTQSKTYRFENINRIFHLKK
jgi:spermidine synthase